jgi:hypothetical protein
MLSQTSIRFLSTSSFPRALHKESPAGDDEVVRNGFVPRTQDQEQANTPLPDIPICKA